jgi:DNA-binding MarR family transcriptional regulator
MNDVWDDIGFVISSQYRVAVLQNLATGPATPSKIASDSGLAISHISRALGKLRDRTMVELLVSEDQKKGRVYGITEHGEQVWQKITAEKMVETE